MHSPRLAASIPVRAIHRTVLLLVVFAFAAGSCGEDSADTTDEPPGLTCLSYCLDVEQVCGSIPNYWNGFVAVDGVTQHPALPPGTSNTTRCEATCARLDAYNEEWGCQESYQQLLTCAVEEGYSDPEGYIAAGDLPENFYHCETNNSSITRAGVVYEMGIPGHKRSICVGDERHSNWFMCARGDTGGVVQEM